MVAEERTHRGGRLVVCRFGSDAVQTANRTIEDVFCQDEVGVALEDRMSTARGSVMFARLKTE